MPLCTAHRRRRRERAPGPRAGGAGMPVHKFLALLGPLVAREPAVFFEAVMAACTLREGAGGAAPQVVLRKPKARRARSLHYTLPYATLP